MNQKKLTAEQEELINRFLSAYNDLDYQLKFVMKDDDSTSFTKLVDNYGKLHPRWTGRKFLKKVAALRNVLVHEMDNEISYPAVPVLSIVEKLEQILDQFLNPDPIIPKYQRNVIKFQINDSLQNVLEIIHQNAYSQFPIYNHGDFVGLLTENGITRWLSQLATYNTRIIDFEENPIKTILAKEEKRKNFNFVPRTLSTFDAERIFFTSPGLEALLITQSGKPSETLLGIITRWDILDP